MDNLSGPRITSAERMNGGVIVTFDDGMCAIYSSALLYENLGRAQIVMDDPEEDES